MAELRTRGAQHDTLSFGGGDCDDSVADVVARAHGPGDGSAVIVVDLGTQDAVQLAGVTARGPAAYRGDLAFRA